MENVILQFLAWCKVVLPHIYSCLFNDGNSVNVKEDHFMATYIIQIIHRAFFDASFLYFRLFNLMYVLILLHYDNWLSFGAHYQHKVRQHSLLQMMIQQAEHQSNLVVQTVHVSLHRVALVIFSIFQDSIILLILKHFNKDVFYQLHFGLIFHSFIVFQLFLDKAFKLWFG